MFLEFPEAFLLNTIGILFLVVNRLPHCSSLVKSSLPKTIFPSVVKKPWCIVFRKDDDWGVSRVLFFFFFSVEFDLTILETLKIKKSSKLQPYSRQR